jgi:hypothetical protein
MLMKKSWLSMVVSGLLLAGCGGPMEGEGLEGPKPEDTSSFTTTTTTTTTSTTPPAVIEMYPRMDMRALWPDTTSVRRFVILVAYSMPTDASGYTPPPRFRAFGVDAANRSYHFQVDGDRATFLNAFMEAMFAEGATIVSTPPGMLLDVPSTTTIPIVTRYGADGSVTAASVGRVTASADSEPGFSTEPVVRSGSRTGGGGMDPWNIAWPWVSGIASNAGTSFTMGNYDYLATKKALGQLAHVEAPEAR